jgi:hypothetical protein
MQPPRVHCFPRAAVPQPVSAVGCGNHCWPVYSFKRKRNTEIHLLHPFLDSVVGIATGYRLDRRVGVRVLVGSRIFSPPRRPDRLWGPPSLLSNDYQGALSPGVKRQWREADHSPPASAEVKKMCGSIHPLPHTPSLRSA